MLLFLYCMNFFLTFKILYFYNVIYFYKNYILTNVIVCKIAFNLISFNSLILDKMFFIY